MNIGLLDVVICFNDGFSARLDVLKELEFDIGENTLKILKTIEKTKNYNSIRKEKSSKNKNIDENSDYRSGLADVN